MAASSTGLYLINLGRSGLPEVERTILISKTKESLTHFIKVPVRFDNLEGKGKNRVIVRCYGCDPVSPELIRVSVKVNDLKGLLNVRTKEILSAYRDDELEALIFNKLPLQDLSNDQLSTIFSEKSPDKAFKPLRIIRKTFERPFKKDSKATGFIDKGIDLDIPLMNLSEISDENSIIARKSPIYITCGVINPEEIRVFLEDRYGDFKFSFDQFMIMFNYFHALDPARLSDSFHIMADDTGLPRSLLYISEGRLKGPYIILKDKKNGVKSVGAGSFATVSFAMNFEGDLFAFKSILSENVKMSEWIINERLQQYPEHFVAGPLVEYVGKTTVKEAVEGELKLKERANKVGILLPYIDGNDLVDYVNEDLQCINYQNKIVYHIAYSIAKKVAFLHKRGMIHLDIKLENILIDTEQNVFLADFGHSTLLGQVIKRRGSPGYIDPAMCNGPKMFPASFAHDIWSLGITLCTLKHGGEMESWTEQREGNFEKLAKMSAEEFSNHKDIFLPNRRNLNSIDWIINKCLQLDPTKRATAQEVAVFMRGLIRDRRLRKKAIRDVMTATS